MPTAKLTIAAVKAARYPKGWKKNRTYYVWDTQMPGFGFRVYPSGRKTFIATYRNQATGTKRFHRIGPIPPLTVVEAREIARTVLVQVYQGSDPSADRQQGRHGMTVQELADMYLERYAHPKKRSARDDESRLRLYILPALGSRRISEVKRTDVAALHAQVAKTSAVTANRLLPILSMMFKLAITWGFLPETHANPTRGIPKLPERKRRRYLSEAEAADLIKAADMEDDPRIPAAIRLYMLLGCRRRELLDLKWSDVNFEHGHVRFRDRKGSDELWLRPSVAAMGLFTQLTEYRVVGNPYVIAGRVPGKPLESIRNAWDRIRDRAKLCDVHLHDLRATAATWLGQSGASATAIKAALGHADLAMTDIYTRMGGADTADPLAKLAEIVERVEKKAVGDNVIPLRRGKRRKRQRVKPPSRQNNERGKRSDLGSPDSPR